MTIRDTSSFMNGEPPNKGDKITLGVFREACKLGLGILATACEIYTLPTTLATSLTYVSLRGAAAIAGVKPSNVDYEVMAAHILTGLPIQSKDGDIYITLGTFYYYEGLARRLFFANTFQHYFINALQISAIKYGPTIEHLLKLWGEKLF